MALCGVNEGKLMVSLKNSFKLFHDVLLLEQLVNKWIIVSSSWLQKEQTLVSLNLKISVVVVLEWWRTVYGHFQYACEGYKMSI